MRFRDKVKMQTLEAAEASDFMNLWGYLGLAFSPGSWFFITVSLSLYYRVPDFSWKSITDRVHRCRAWGGLSPSLVREPFLLCLSWDGFYFVTKVALKLCSSCLRFPSDEIINISRPHLASYCFLFCFIFCLGVVWFVFVYIGFTVFCFKDTRWPHVHLHRVKVSSVIKQETCILLPASPLNLLAIKQSEVSVFENNERTRWEQCLPGSLPVKIRIKQ